MKTAMQELIEYVTKYEELIGATATMVKDKATNLLEKEKEQMVKEYNDGYNKGMISALR